MSLESLTGNFDMLADSVTSRMKIECVGNEHKKSMFCIAREECDTLYYYENRAQKDREKGGCSLLEEPPSGFIGCLLCLPNLWQGRKGESVGRACIFFIIAVHLTRRCYKISPGQSCMIQILVRKLQGLQEHPIPNERPSRFMNDGLRGFYSCFFPVMSSWQVVNNGKLSCAFDQGFRAFSTRRSANPVGSQQTQSISSDPTSQHKLLS